MMAGPHSENEQSFPLETAGRPSPSGLASSPELLQFQIREDNKRVEAGQVRSECLTR